MLFAPKDGAEASSLMTGSIKIGVGDQARVGVDAVWDGVRCLPWRPVNNQQERREALIETRYCQCFICVWAYFGDTLTCSAGLISLLTCPSLTLFFLGS